MTSPLLVSAAILYISKSSSFGGYSEFRDGVLEGQIVLGCALLNHFDGFCKISISTYFRMNLRVWPYSGDLVCRGIPLVEVS